MQKLQRRIIGLLGPRGAGKDEVGNYLVKRHGFAKIAFADAIRSEAAAQWNVNVLNFLDRRQKELPTRWLAVQACRDSRFVDWFNANNQNDLLALYRHRSPRWVLQQWGSYRVATCSPDYWIERVRERLERMPRQKDIVITDVRTVEEIAFIGSLTDDAHFDYIKPGYAGYREGGTTTHARTDSPIWEDPEAVALMRNGLWTTSNNAGLDTLAHCIDVLLKEIDGRISRP